MLFIAETTITIEAGLLAGLVGAFVSIGIVWGAMRSKVSQISDRLREIDKDRADLLRRGLENHDYAMTLQQKVLGIESWQKAVDDRCKTHREDFIRMQRDTNDAFTAATTKIMDICLEIKVAMASNAVEMRTLNARMDDMNKRMELLSGRVDEFGPDRRKVPSLSTAGT